MSKLIRAPKPPRHPLAPRLSTEQEAARLAQSKRDRRKIVAGIVLRAQPSPTPAERWRALRKARAAEIAASVDPAKTVTAVDLAKPEDDRTTIVQRNGSTIIAVGEAAHKAIEEHLKQLEGSAS